jgi:cellobiose-specific phosphotransferase system component IIC
MKPLAKSIGVFITIRPPNIVATQLKILIPVGTAIIIVALVKYARVSTSKPTVNMWCAQTIKPKKPIESIAYIIPRLPKTAFDENLETM